MFVAGPARIFLAYRLPGEITTENKHPLDIPQGKMANLLSSLGGNGFGEDYSEYHAILFEPSSIANLVHPVFEVFRKLEHYVLCLQISSNNPHPRFLGEGYNVSPGIEAIAGVELLDAIEDLSEAFESPRLLHDLSNFGLTLEHLLYLIPQRFQWAMETHYPLAFEAGHVKTALEVLAASCSKYAPLTPLSCYIIDDIDS